MAKEKQSKRKPRKGETEILFSTHAQTLEANISLQEGTVVFDVKTTLWAVLDLFGPSQHCQVHHSLPFHRKTSHCVTKCWLFSWANCPGKCLYSVTADLCKRNSCLVFTNKSQCQQRAKKVVSDNPGLVDFAIRLVNSVLNLPKGQVSFLGNSNYRRTVINVAYQKISWASTYQQQLARMPSHKTDFLCTLSANDEKTSSMNIILVTNELNYYLIRNFVVFVFIFKRKQTKILSRHLFKF